MRRRDFIGLLGGAVAWPLPSGAQQEQRLSRVGLLLPATVQDAEYPTLVNAFVQSLQEAGWSDGQNVRIDVRWTGGSAELIYKHAVELVGLGAAVIVAAGSSTTGPLLRATRSIPVVFTIVPDPVGAGFVDTLARPGGNATGFASFDYGIGGKWLELLKEIAPSVRRVAVLRDSDITAGIGQWGAIQTAAPSFGMQASPINLREASEVERAVAAFARSPNGGLILTSGAMAIRHRNLVIRLAAEHKVPAIYYARAFVGVGGLISYGPDRTDQFRQAAGYVARILKGENPADLPVQGPTKYELVVNLKTAKALGITIPPTVLARADEVIE